MSAAVNGRPARPATRRLEGFLASGGVVWILVLALVIFAALVSEDFRTDRNLANVSRQAVVLSLVALGQLRRSGGWYG